MDRALARVEEWYRGDGWYSDGAGAPSTTTTDGPCTSIPSCTPTSAATASSSNGTAPGRGPISRATHASSAPTVHRCPTAVR
ncbi:DUF2264 domain-containing protein [Streptomyces sp. NPDC058423]|uniref:DUF2264 domain-containing protein n=1 Tax=unclassified Streptomyces TaxID=2593676 RepID=UPI00364F2DD0